jgi:hypothetical protein
MEDADDDKEKRRFSQRKKHARLIIAVYISASACLACAADRSGNRA